MTPNLGQGKVASPEYVRSEPNRRTVRAAGARPINRPQKMSVELNVADLILYESGPCLVVCKPSGIATQAPAGIESMESCLKAWLLAREGRDGNIYLGVPHRLDRPASGALVFARNSRAAARVSRQFEERTVRKSYWALVAGNVVPTSGEWIDNVRKIYGRPLAEIVADDDPTGRRAVLRYRVLAETELGAWLEIELQTGRTHQIRLQAASRGHPILGDFMYGSTIPFGPAMDDERRRPIALHARRLAFRHPMTPEMVDVTAPLPPTWRAALGDDRFLATFS